jgi:hypothetical protein
MVGGGEGTRTEIIVVGDKVLFWVWIRRQRLCLVFALVCDQTDGPRGLRVFLRHRRYNEPASSPLRPVLFSPPISVHHGSHAEPIFQRAVASPKGLL